MGRFPWTLLILVTAFLLLVLLAAQEDAERREFQLKMAEKGYCETTWGKWVPCADMDKR